MFFHVQIIHKNIPTVLFSVLKLAPSDILMDPTRNMFGVNADCINIYIKPLKYYQTYIKRW